MKKISAALLLLCLFAAFVQPARAQSRARRVGDGQRGSEPSTSSQPPAQPTTPRPPTIKGSTQTVNNPSPAPVNNSGKQQSDEVDESDVVRIDTTLVTLPVSVMDRRGRYIPDLRKEDFRIYENGIEQQVAYFATVEKPFTVVLVIDTSRSTRFRLEDIQDAAIAFVDQLRSDDRVMVVSFDDHINVLAEPTNNRAELRQSIRRTRTGGGTRLYDTVDMLINERLSRISGRKAVVLFTDGVDTTSRKATYQSTVHDAEEADALIFPVEYDTYEESRDNSNNNGGGQWPYPQRRRGSGGRRGGIILNLPFPFPMPGGGGGNIPSRGGRGGNSGGGGGGAGSTRAEYERADAYLNVLAQETGARLYRADTLQNIAEAFSLVAEELRRQYSLGYYPKTPPQVGERRQIKVRVNQPDVAVRARDSYIYKASAQSTDTVTDGQQSAPVLRSRHLVRNP
jgi:VWFA-related protein